MPKKLSILVHGSCWPTNIGNAFVQIGINNALDKILGDDQGDIYRYGSISDFLFWQRNLSCNNLNIAEMADFDYVFIGGMTQCHDYFASVEKLLSKFIEKGTKIIIAGGGAGLYSDEEVDAVRKWMKSIPIYGFISRDHYSYEAFADLAEHSFDGIDSAFFLPDGFKPIPFKIPEFNIVNFDIIDEPSVSNYLDLSGKLIEKNNGVLGSIISSLKAKGTSTNGSNVPMVLDMNGKLLIRTHHAPWPGIASEKHFEHQGTLISDLPSDYLNLYSQTNITYSDRIHACIATLAFGNEAMLFGKENPRIRMFERIGAGELLERPVRADMEYLNELKEKQINFLRKLIL